MEKKTTYVSVAKTNCFHYPKNVDCFRPSERYSEYEYQEYSPQKNEIYDTVRESFVLLGLDKDNIGKKEWSPFSEFIHPGDTVLIKPNLVIDKNQNSAEGDECLFTHPSVVAPVLDYTFKALNGKGKVIVGDAPIQKCDFSALVSNSGYDRLIEYYKNKGLDIELVDFRKNITVEKRRLLHRSTLENVPATIVNLGERSEFYGLNDSDTDKLRIVNYPSDTLKQHHHNNVQEYCVSQYALEADVVINVPKPKTHKKAGITASLKNMVGINAQKDYLPHHMAGASVDGGDEYKERNIVQRIRSKLYDLKYILEDKEQYFRARIVWLGIVICTVLLKFSGVEFQNGSWYGNRTVSKMITDLNKILYYADKNGILQKEQCRKQFVVADMIVAGEKMAL